MKKVQNLIRRQHIDWLATIIEGYESRYWRKDLIVR